MNSLEELRFRNLLISPDQTVSFTTLLTSEPACAFASFDFTYQLYFEIEVLQRGQGGSVCIGACPRDHDCRRFPGHGRQSFGYQSTEGCFLFEGRRSAMGPAADANDVAAGGLRWDGEGHVAGCGLDFDRGAIYFTRDGVLVGTKPCEFACRARSGSEQLPKLFPAIGLYGDGATVKVNFGQNPFVYHVANLPSIGARLLQPPGPSYNSNGVAGVTPPAPLVPAWPFVAGADAAPPGPRSLVLPPSADAAADFFAQVLFVCVWRIGDK
eukprot:TRINITY_DN6226_c0_g1_i1.p1 TRINITY_DN6226_c0_g1~~TRINITY_DN6226_c0_g1_i1.p1  ORF type:complete len:268 (-),score=20.07 TRINITY_DN6226_c0_g1_i1:61-864(-)